MEGDPTGRLAASRATRVTSSVLGVELLQRTVGGFGVGHDDEDDDPEYRAERAKWHRQLEEIREQLKIDPPQAILRQLIKSSDQKDVEWEFKASVEQPVPADIAKRQAGKARAGGPDPVQSGKDLDQDIARRQALADATLQMIVETAQAAPIAGAEDLGLAGDFTTERAEQAGPGFQTEQ